MPSIGTYTTSVVVNGRVLREHEPPEDERIEDDLQASSAVTKYIEVVEGASFSITVELQSNTPFLTGELGVWVFIDNTRVGLRTITQQRFLQDGMAMLRFDVAVFRSGDTWTHRSLTFNKLVTTDVDVNHKQLKDIAEGLGTIQVQVYNTTSVKYQGEPNVQEATNIGGRASPIPERALKGQPVDLLVSFGQGRSFKVAEFYRTQRIGNPLLDCIFKYRSRQALQMLDIIPATPEPVPLRERNPQDLNLSEARELLSHLQNERIKPDEMKTDDFRFKEESFADDQAGLAITCGSERRAGSEVFEANDSDDDDVVFVKVRKVSNPSPDGKEVTVLDLT